MGLQNGKKMAIGEGSNFPSPSPFAKGTVQLENRIVPFSRYVAFAAVTHRKRGELPKRPRDDPPFGERERPELRPRTGNQGTAMTGKGDNDTSAESSPRARLRAP